MEDDDRLYRSPSWEWVECVLGRKVDLLKLKPGERDEIVRMVMDLEGEEFPF